jgi:glycosyltransferase involved in cell wall biosynthesis
MRVLLLHNRYRVEGGEERAVELQLRALQGAGIEHALFERSSGEAGRLSAATALLRGGSADEDVATAVRGMGADVVHAHNMLPLIGPRGLAAASAAGARVLLQLHNARLFCAIGVASRDGGPCFRCHGRLTLPGLVLNCRGSLPEAAAYATALSVHQPLVFRSVDRFVAPSSWSAAQLTKLGLPGERVDVLPHYLPAESFAERSRAGDGGYVLVLSRLSAEKGIDTAVAAAVRTRVPLKVAGDGPLAAELAAHAHGLGAPVEFLGRVGGDEVPGLLAGAAALAMPSRCHEFAPFAALEAMAAGVPVVGSRLGALPELIGEERCVPANDAAALGERLRALWDDPGRRATDGDALLARARERHSEQRYTAALRALYAQITSA